MRWEGSRRLRCPSHSSVAANTDGQGKALPRNVLFTESCGGRNFFCPSPSAALLLALAEVVRGADPAPPPEPVGGTSLQVACIVLRLSGVSWERASLSVMKTHADLGTPGVWGLRRAGVVCLSSGTSAGSRLFVSAGCHA